MGKYEEHHCILKVAKEVAVGSRAGTELICGELESGLNVLQTVDADDLNELKPKEGEV